MGRLMFVVVVVVVAMSRVEAAMDVSWLRRMAARGNTTALLVFGDSSVDPGNNNRLSTTFKSNFPPYGKDFFNGKATGRFSNGRLPTDFIALMLGFAKSIPAFLDPNLKPEELRHGVSFASAASGYDDLTANLTKVLSFEKQLEYLRHYKNQLRMVVGYEEEERIVRNAIFVVSAGTNDFIQNYFMQPQRSKQYTVPAYVDYLISQATLHIKEMHRLGATKVAVVGVPPLGCMPISKTLMGVRECIRNFNEAAALFNSKVTSRLELLKKQLGLRTSYIDVYGVIMAAINNPKKYGFTETRKGCIGSGVIEIGETCIGQSTCKDPDRYVFWDAVHPSQKMYGIIAYKAMAKVASEILQ
ncbi:GDSL esterase/lipase [Acorus gramineus]|uniref:GDSL esterase/lipase n=1 Tax=Acorus gramineus TaxID=55184 RepID=A0AAV9BIK2_ACOGR|nr:GDSL esterase/lipase [Acorus gramineus]